MLKLDRLKCKVRPAIVIGAGGHARVLQEALLLCGIEVLGFTDLNPAVWGTCLHGSRVLGGDDLIGNYEPKDVFLVNGMGSTDQPLRRALVYEKWKNEGYSFLSVIHPAAILSQQVSLAEGVQIMAGAIVQTGSVLKENVLINTGAQVDHDGRIGAHSHVAPGAVLSGNVHIGERCHIGLGSKILQGVTIGTRSVVGAGAVVLGDVPSDCKVAGVPARRISK